MRDYNHAFLTEDMNKALLIRKPEIIEICRRFGTSSLRIYHCSIVKCRTCFRHWRTAEWTYL